MDHGVQQTKQMQRSSTSISKALQQHLQAGTLTVQPASAGGSAARATTTAKLSALSARAAPSIAAREPAKTFLPRSASIKSYLFMYDHVSLTERRHDIMSKNYIKYAFGGG